MGLERIAAVLQGVHDNYDTDLFKTLIAASDDADRRPRPRATRRPSHRVIADHLRSSSFLIADGVDARPTRAAAMCCAGSCAGPCATPTCWAPPSP